jgi:hypothetical protein
MTVSVFSGISGTKATGLAVLAGGVAESVFSPLFWIPAVLLFALFYAASQLRNNLLRVFLFWIPTVTAAVFCIAFVALYAYLFIRCQTSLRCAVQANELSLSGCEVSKSGHSHSLTLLVNRHLPEFGPTSGRGFICG